MKKLTKLSLGILSTSLVIPTVSIFAADSLKGDINKDGQINAKDAVVILKLSTQDTTITDEMLQLADMNGDHVIDAKDATKVLHESITKVDKNILKTNIDAATNLLKGNYTATSKKALSNIITNATVIYNSDTSTQDEVNDINTSLLLAMDDLVALGDTTELSALIKTTESTYTTQVGIYTVETMNALTDSLKSAKLLIKNADVTDAMIRDAIKDLNAKINALRIDTTSLKTLITTMNAKDFSAYKPSSVTKFKETLTLATTLSNKVDITQNDMNAMINRINTEYLALELKDDMTQEEAFNQLQSLMNEYTPDMDRNDYTYETYNPFSDKMVALNGAIRRGEISTTTNVDVLKNHYNELKALHDALEVTTEAKKLAEQQQALRDLCDLILTKDFSEYADVDVMPLKREIPGIQDFMETEEFNDVDYVNMNIDYLQRTLDAVRLNSELDHTTVYTADMSSMLAMLNAKRAENGLASNITFDSELNKAATIRATEMSIAFSTDYATAETQFHLYAHQRPDFQTPCFTVGNEINYKDGITGENAAMGSSQAEALFKAWVASPGHYAIMMDKEINQVGIACVKVGDHQWLAYMVTGYNSSLPLTISMEQEDTNNEIKEDIIHY